MRGTWALFPCLPFSTINYSCSSPWPPSPNAKLFLKELPLCLKNFIFKTTFKSQKPASFSTLHTIYVFCLINTKIAYMATYYIGVNNIINPHSSNVVVVQHFINNQHFFFVNFAARPPTLPEASTTSKRHHGINHNILGFNDIRWPKQKVPLISMNVGLGHLITSKYLSISISISVSLTPHLAFSSIHTQHNGPTPPSS
ncbi:hypothetical protein L3X38_013146 [Prunus dulcis]|uniref:Uncharacterized protein n=1 Tax=Prunus dulcis TaxID=3755 RepID=A0AAD4WKX9_PRUDU|nr:hypothetical protein L3X38_013146 [Prunus dulcis]